MVRRAFWLSALLLACVTLVSAAQAAPAKKQRVLLQWAEGDSLGQWIMPLLSVRVMSIQSVIEQLSAFSFQLSACSRSIPASG